MNQQRTRLITWGLVMMTLAGIIVQLVIWVRSLTGRSTLFDLVETFGWGMAIPLVFAVLATLIISREPGNRVGWLMVVVALGAVNPVTNILESIADPPETLTYGMFILLWMDGWSWIPFIFAIFLIPLHFPTGRPPTPRWNWVNYLALFMWLFFMTITPFIDIVQPINGDWTLDNPIGFIPGSFFEGPFIIVWGIGLITLVGASVASLFVRYRRAGSVERQQIKWLLYAGALLAGYYAINFFYFSEIDSSTNDIENLLFVLSILAMPTAIAIAILRYRLYEIDVIIRKTLVYAILTGILGLVYFGTVIGLQTVIGRANNEQSPLIIVLSTLLIAALFTPLRRRVQSFIDRRFYRRSYNAQQVLAQFAETTRDQVALEQLTQSIHQSIAEALQPKTVSIWLPQDRKSARNG